MADDQQTRVERVARRMERLRQSNPMNGDGSNRMLTQALNVLIAEFPECRDAAVDEQRRRDAEETERYERRHREEMERAAERDNLDRCRFCGLPVRWARGMRWNRAEKKFADERHLIRWDNGLHPDVCSTNSAADPVHEVNAPIPPVMHGQDERPGGVV